jgi:hypothetical protein
MRTITWMCSLEMLAPLGVLAAPAPEPGSTVVVEAVVEGSVVGMIAGEAAPAALEVEGATSADVRAAAPAQRAIEGEAVTAGRTDPKSVPSRAATASVSAEPPSDGATRAGRSAEIAGVGAWQRDVAIMLGAGVAGTLLFVAGGRRLRRRS